MLLLGCPGDDDDDVMSGMATEPGTDTEPDTGSQPESASAGDTEPAATDSASDASTGNSPDPTEGDTDAGPVDTDTEGAARFPCGVTGGSCDRDTEVCVVDGPAQGQCWTCTPRAEGCDARATCGCLPPANEPAFGNHHCLDAGTCEEVDGGLVVTCTRGSADWGCG